MQNISKIDAYVALGVFCSLLVYFFFKCKAFFSCTFALDSTINNVKPHVSVHCQYLESGVVLMRITCSFSSRIHTAVGLVIRLLDVNALV